MDLPPRKEEWGPMDRPSHRRSEFPAIVKRFQFQFGGRSGSPGPPVLVWPLALRRRFAFLAGTDAAEMFVGIDAGLVAVAPVDPDGVAPDGLHCEHLERGLEHRKRSVPGRARRATLWARGRSVRPGALRARALVPQVLEAVFAAVTVFPVDLDSLRLGDRD